jgi:hypothetical protein
MARHLRDLRETVALSGKGDQPLASAFDDRACTGIEARHRRSSEAEPVPRGALPERGQCVDPARTAAAHRVIIQEPRKMRSAIDATRNPSREGLPIGAPAAQERQPCRFERIMPRNANERVAGAPDLAAPDRMNLPSLDCGASVPDYGT